MTLPLPIQLQTVIEQRLYAKAKALVEAVRLQEAATLLETLSQDDDIQDDGYKGWMSPTGRSHVFSPHTEHAENLHPDLKRYHIEGGRPRQGPGRSGPGCSGVVSQAQQLGFTRFGKHGGQQYLHYDGSTPKGRKSALHALKYLSPNHADRIDLSDEPGWAGRDFDMTPSKAARHIRESRNADETIQLCEGYWQNEMKGWMSPSGEPHLFDPNGEHWDNHHPDIAHNIGTHGFDSITKAQQLGYTRFGHAEKPDTELSYIHYDKTSPEGRRSALHALHYIKPGHQSKVLVTGKAGMAPNRKEYELSPSAAARHIKEERQLLLLSDPYPRVEKDHEGHPVLPTKEQFAQYFEDMQAKYIQDKLDTAQDRWKEAADEAEKKNDEFAKARLEALGTEIEVATKVLSTKLGYQYT